VEPLPAGRLREPAAKAAGDLSLPRVWGCPKRGAGSFPCRESEGVPHIVSLIPPQEWGIKGVDKKS
jgi:hypothetical protein